MADNTDGTIQRIKAVYDMCMDKLKNLTLTERAIMKEYREIDRREKIKKIKDELGA
jgi:hypothetical protein